MNINFMIIAYDKSDLVTSVQYLNKILMVVYDYPPNNLETKLNSNITIGYEFNTIYEINAESFTDDWDRKLEYVF